MPKDLICWLTILLNTSATDLLVNYIIEHTPAPDLLLYLLLVPEVRGEEGPGVQQSQGEHNVLDSSIN